jgi:hypothetical protein
VPKASATSAYQWRFLGAQDCRRAIRRRCTAYRPVQRKAMTIMSGTNKDAVPQSELDRYGIERVPADIFLWGGYRYSNARDAIAAAKRNAK